MQSAINIRKKLLAQITSTYQRINSIAEQRNTARLSIVGVALWAVCVGSLFVIVSLPRFLTRTRRQDFEKTARIDEDGGILDSYSNYIHHYEAGIAVCTITLVAFSILVLGAGAIKK